MKRSSRRKAFLSQRGFSLIEIVIALGVGGVLTYAVVTLLKNSGKEAASLNAKADYTGLVNEMQQVFNSPDRCRAAFGAPNTVVPSLTTLGLPGDPTTVPVPVVINTGNTVADAVRGPLGTPYAAGVKWGNSLVIQSFEFLGKKALGDRRNTQYTMPLQIVASRRVGQDRTGSETAAGGDILRKTFNLVVALDGSGKIVGCSGQNRAVWKSTGPGGLDIIYNPDDGVGRVGILDTVTDPRDITKLDVAGTAQASGFQYRSDARLKNNVREISGALERVLRLHGVLFDWKDRELAQQSGDQLGFLAQEVEAVFPEVVTTDPATGLKSVAYEQLVGPMIEAIKARQEILLRQQRDLAEIRKAALKQ